MPHSLDGGCLVFDHDEGQPSTIHDVCVRHLVGRNEGAVAVSLRVIEMPAQASMALRSAESEEVLYLLEGDALVAMDDGGGGAAAQARAGTAIYVAPGSSMTATAQAEALRILSVRCPEPAGSGIDAVTARTWKEGPLNAAVHLDERDTARTSDRWYKVLLDARVGSETVTLFVGSIPPGRAPDHFHEYEEVLCILKGEGVMWAGTTSAPVAVGSCVYLPRRQVHCLENTGTGELRLVGIFHPAGSPAVSYPTDGE